MKTTLLLLLAGASLAIAQHSHGDQGKEITMTSLVVDTGCYMSHSSKGEKHEQCATSCAKAGVPLALLDEASGTLYLPVATDHKNQNDKLRPFIEKKVKLQNSIGEANQTGLPEINRVCDGLLRDEKAVTAAVVLPWSNGQVEGQIHRPEVLLYPVVLPL